MLRAEELETTLLQAKQFHSRIFAGTHRLVPLRLGSPQSPELGFSKLSKLCVETGNHSSTGSIQQGGSSGMCTMSHWSPLLWLAQHR